MNYKIIQDENLFREFIEWLPELASTEKYYCCLFSRSKYCKDENGINTIPHIKSDKAQLKRILTDKNRLFEKVKQLECEIGAYRHNQLPVPQQALALYITLNPRDTWKASFNSTLKLMTAIRDNNKLMNPVAEVLSEVQKAKGTTHYVTFDIDAEDNNIQTLAWHAGHVLDCVNQEAVTFVRTRSGMHVLVAPRKVEWKYQNSWFKNISAIAGIDQGLNKKGEVSEIMLPVVGCTQGDFTPHFINF